MIYINEYTFIMLHLCNNKTKKNVIATITYEVYCDHKLVQDHEYNIRKPLYIDKKYQYESYNSIKLQLLIDSLHKSYLIKLCDNDRIIGYINFETWIDHTVKNCATLTALFVSQKYRKQGYATLLMKYFIQIIKNKHIYKIHLDDMSEKFRHCDNIYLKFGFKYTNKTGPEMVKSIKCFK